MAHMLEGADVRACRVYDGPLDLRRRQKLVDQKAVPLEKLFQLRLKKRRAGKKIAPHRVILLGGHQVQGIRQQTVQRHAAELYRISAAEQQADQPCKAAADADNRSDQRDFAEDFSELRELLDGLQRFPMVLLF